MLMQCDCADLQLEMGILTLDNVTPMHEGLPALSDEMERCQ
jgi:hypothetical protein